MAKFIVNAGEVIDHDGKVYNEGDAIELTAAQAKELAKKVTKGKGGKDETEDLPPVTPPTDQVTTDGVDDEDGDDNAGDEDETEDENVEAKVVNLVKNYKLDELRAKAADLQIEFTEEATKKDLANLIALKEAA